MPLWARLMVAIAALRVAVAMALYLAGYETFTLLPLPPVAYAALAATFAVVGSMLVVANRHDVRAEWLGGVFLLLTTPLGPTVLPALGATAWLVHCRVDSLLPCFMWRFVAVFPSTAVGGTHRLARAAATLAAVLGAAAAVTNLSYVFLPPPGGGDWRGLLAAGPRLSQSWFWLMVTGLSAPALAFLIWRSRRVTPEERQRVQLFVAGLLAGVVPFTLEVAMEQAVPTYSRFVHTPSVEPIVGTVLFSAFGFVPLLTAYSVLFDRLFDVRFVLRMAVQYVLARYTVIALTLIPFAALAIFGAQHRHEPLMALFTGIRPALLAAAVVAGLATLRLRDSWLDKVDRRFFRDSYDARQVLTQLIGGLQAPSANELGSVIQRELGRGLHTQVEMFVIDGDNHALRHVDHAYPPLPARATLLTLAMANPQLMDVELTEASSLRRLPTAEREWLAVGGFSSVVCLRGSGGRCNGLIALKRKRSELAYSDEDARLLTAVASAAGLALENLRLRSSQDSSEEPSATECVGCGRVRAHGQTHCPCGGFLTACLAPLTLRSKFQLIQRVGEGGMGVVYRAVDLSLGRDVAIKTLPSVTSDHVERLRREARAMARLTHPNLAVVHGIEMWRGVPFLIEEFLDGGTLRDRLRAGCLPVVAVLDLGITLADVLAELQRNGIVHCDLKPSNIGYSRTGTLKLLDFGLARMFGGLPLDGGRSHTTLQGPYQSAERFSFSAHGIAGTPSYMAPEAVAGERPTPAFDLWALGVVLFESVSGRRPFEGTDAADVLRAISRCDVPPVPDIVGPGADGLVAIIRALLAPRPADRPSDTVVLATALRRLRQQLA